MSLMHVFDVLLIYSIIWSITDGKGHESNRSKRVFLRKRFFVCFCFTTLSINHYFWVFSTIVKRTLPSRKEKCILCKENTQTRAQE